MKNYTYFEAIEFFRNMAHFVPPKEKSGGAKDFFSLDAELALLEKLGKPQNKLKYVHVAGTNGKGSTTAYLESILNEASVLTGAFTSPFLYSYNELFRVGGQDISDQDFAETFSIVKEKYDELVKDKIYPSEYEFLTCMAFIYFIKMECQIVLMEVSLGGRVDTTNVIPAPLVSIITPISYDHMTILGNSLTEIAREKAGIIKPGTIVVSARQEFEVVKVLKATCKEKEVQLILSQGASLVERDIQGQTFQVKNLVNEDKQVRFDQYFTSLLGTYQIDNAAVAINAAMILKNKEFAISEEAIRAGVEKTKWFGRFSLIKEKPITIIDGGHNRQGAKVLRESLEAYFPNQKVTFVMGILADKEVDLILSQLMPKEAKCYCLQVPNPRSLKPEELAKKVESFGVKAQVITSVDQVFEEADEADIICITGSLYLISKIF